MKKTGRRSFVRPVIVAGLLLSSIYLLLHFLGETEGIDSYILLFSSLFVG